MGHTKGHAKGHAKGHLTGPAGGAKALRTVAGTALAVTALAAGTLAAAAPAGAATQGGRVATAFVLPGAKVYPEGIAQDARTGDVYVGSYADGTVYRARPGRATAEVFLPAGTDGRDTANGLRVDAHGRLWVTDSTTGVAVYDPRSRTRLAHFEVPGSAPFFVNDLTITPDGTAYLTDSLRGTIHRVTPAQLAQGSGALEPAYTLPVAPGAIGLNGIVSDPAGRWLLAVDMTAGVLHRVDLRTGARSEVTLHGGDLKHADGLHLSPDGTLRVAHNTTNTLTRWRLTDDATHAHLTRTLTDPNLQIPTTLTHTRGRTLVVRSQFDKGGPMTPSTGTPTTFTVATIRGL
ncbi:SMP-30/gluconolactonase/LRE family protein [Streptomyces antimicrobicus]|uniref:SMP-30/gluconolactonase/LRE family protein n=1 Tax=Streptomyces antimicrobicus TaxID=2883108 RepID=A0ABS8B920_9ACTN|nr:SMP-30/gluconolactonase/LRE family protein [Streptomyces antimicrobicus]MCB5181107.1 SMP-30/gluconolactonase/LRE family protein [Streptomyces antimicrobicus]